MGLIACYVGDVEMSEACLEQIKFWSRALRQSNKAIKRKNKHINRLERENTALREQLADAYLAIADAEITATITST